MNRIAITGPECSGKTHLAHSLFNQHGGTLILEYARRYLEKTGGAYQAEDLDVIALGQMRQWLPASGCPIICDTEMTTMKIWSLEKYGVVSKLIQKLYEAQQFDLYLLCRPDISWEEDPLRESPYDRERLFSLYEKSLKEMNRHYIVIDESNRDGFTLEHISAT